MNKFSIGNNLRKLRFNENEMTQQQLADKIGVTRQTIVAIEKGNYSPSLELAFKIALAFNVPGQSGDPRSKHYGDLFDPWSKDTPFPLLYTRGAIEKVTEMKILLVPVQ